MVATKGALARSTGIEIQSFNIAAATTISAGQTVALDAAGRAVLGTNSVGTVARGIFIAAETVNNAAGAAGDLEIRCAVGNTYIYTEAGGTIKVGEAVKADSASKCAAATGVFAAETHLGRYVGHENEEKDPTDAAAGDTIIVRLGF
jgi:hypothetical protein|tara:strand:- start:3053 stop:3493 length:441 start_codon:yes stop_codon:yes gene_type:complete